MISFQRWHPFEKCRGIACLGHCLATGFQKIIFFKTIACSLEIKFSPRFTLLLQIWPAAGRAAGGGAGHTSGISRSPQQWICLWLLL